MSTDKRMAARTRFMIRDLMDMREEKWVPRRLEAKATKTEEFRKELGENKGAAKDGSQV